MQSSEWRCSVVVSIIKFHVRGKKKYRIGRVFIIFFILIRSELIKANAENFFHQ